MKLVDEDAAGIVDSEPSSVVSTSNEFREDDIVDPAIVVDEVLVVPNFEVRRDSEPAVDGGAMDVIVRSCVEHEVATILARGIKDEIVDNLVGGFVVVDSPCDNEIDVVAVEGPGDCDVIAVADVLRVKEVAACDIVDVLGSDEVAASAE